MDSPTSSASRDEGSSRYQHLRRLAESRPARRGTARTGVGAVPERRGAHGTARRSHDALGATRAGLVRAYEAGGRLVTPSARTFADAALILQRLHSRGREIRRASLVHDVLIALTVRSLGATLYTTNATDFEAIRNLLDFPLQVVTP